MGCSLTLLFIKLHLPLCQRTVSGVKSHMPLLLVISFIGRLLCTFTSYVGQGDAFELCYISDMYRHALTFFFWTYLDI